ncbi:hypothetical protein RHMOL_Rhmol01G0075000 [Rhododendron molle]|uniref:Uncharacterized protein n=1 Tax=Rhododendron molle TaxID=49168 RepID=A0ACC0Q0G1_RHOML|nr:hypothetical protein RHMOL_Rhmol01G0075000 [Rhododendron molle]
MAFVMTVTSSFLILVMIMIRKINILLVILYILIIGSVELLYLSSVLYKFNQGGHLPLAAFLMVIMFIWNDVYRRKYCYELDHKVSPIEVKEIFDNGHFCRVPRLAIFFSDLEYGWDSMNNLRVEDHKPCNTILVSIINDSPLPP